MATSELGEMTTRELCDELEGWQDITWGEELSKEAARRLSRLDEDWGGFEHRLAQWLDENPGAQVHHHLINEARLLCIKMQQGRLSRYAPIKIDPEDESTWPTEKGLEFWSVKRQEWLRDAPTRSDLSEGLATYYRRINNEPPE